MTNRSTSPSLFTSVGMKTNNNGSSNSVNKSVLYPTLLLCPDCLTQQSYKILTIIIQYMIDNIKYEQ
eukprot:UN08261